MIKIENVEVVGWEHAIRGMRNPKNSWERSDSGCCADLECTECSLYSKEESCCDHEGYFILGNNDHKLASDLAAGGPVHAKYRRMIVVYLDITAPLYWWKEFDTYKVGTVANSCSTMHKIHEKEFTLEDFSCEHLLDGFNHNDERDVPYLDFSPLRDESAVYPPRGILECVTIPMLNLCREKFLETKDKKYWWQMIQLLPSSYNQKRTVMLNYEVLANIYKFRKNHKLDEWCLHETPIEHRERNKDFTSGLWGFCDWIESLPYSELITGKTEPEFPPVPLVDVDYRNRVLANEGSETMPLFKEVNNESGN